VSAFSVAELSPRLSLGAPKQHFQSLAVVLPSHEICGRREPFEVFGFQWSFTVGRFEQAIRLRPCVLLEGLPGTRE
jgi:hypothetical protein